MTNPTAVGGAQTVKMIGRSDITDCHTGATSGQYRRALGVEIEVVNRRSYL